MQKININVALWVVLKDLKQLSFSVSPLIILSWFHVCDVESAKIISKMKVEEENLESLARTKETT